MEKIALKYYYGLMMITLFFLIIVFILQNSITSKERKLQKDIREYSNLFNENNLLKAELSYSLRTENFNVFTHNKMQEYKTILPNQDVYIKDLQSAKQ